MKLLFIMLALLLTCRPGAAQNKPVKNSGRNKLKTGVQNEKAFGVAVFNALRAGNIDGWIALYPTNDEYGSILQAGLAAKAEGLTQQIIDDILVKRKKEAAGAYAKIFEHYCQLADSAGVDWKDAVFEKFSFTNVYPEPVKLKYLDAMIWFRCKQQHFVVDGVQAVEIATGYKLQALAGMRALEPKSAAR